MSEPIRLHPSPDVAIAAWRFEAESEGPQAFHDVALMLGEFDPDRCPVSLGGHTETLRGGYAVVCWACKVLLRYFSCDCPSAVFNDRACKHVIRCVELLAEERSTARKAQS